MKKEDFTIALSERERESAIKEVCLKIKSEFPRETNHIFLLFTPHYNPTNIIKTLALTLKPKKVIGLQAPALIFENRIIDKGIIGCCINKAGINSKEIIIKSNQPQEIESLMRLELQSHHNANRFILSLLAPQLNPQIYLQSLYVALGRSLPLLGIGYSNPYASFAHQIINNTIINASSNIVLDNIETDFVQIDGYVPIGKPFSITKASSERSIISEINNQPAVSLYKHYCQTKFEVFKKNHLFSLYPLGIITDGLRQLVRVTDILEDGSLVCTGEIKENTSGNIMLIDQSLATEALLKKIQPFEDLSDSLFFVVDSLSRKKILKNSAQAEISLLRESLGGKNNIIGVFADYALAPDKERGYITMDTSGLIVSSWN